jgi:hypothetical protein
MDPRRENQNNGRQRDRRNPDHTLVFAGVIVLFEIAVAATVVVGFFSALAGPFGWTGLLQFVVCAGLAALLWRTDARLGSDEAAGSHLNGHEVSRQPV